MSSQHGLAAIAEARRLDGGDLQAAAQLVDDERGQRLAVDVFGDDQQRLAGLRHRLEDRQQRLQRAELLLVDENVGILEFSDHLLGVGDEVGRQIAAVELHALDDVGLGLEALGLLDRDHAVIADLLHRLGDHVADELIAIGRDRADLGDLVVRGDFPRVLCEVDDDGLDGEVDAALQIHRIERRRPRPLRLRGRSSRDHGGGGGSVASRVVLLGGDFAHQLGAKVLELVGKLDLLGDGDAVLGDARRAVGFFHNDVATLGAERDFHCIVEKFDAAHDSVARVGGETDVFGSHCDCNSVREEEVESAMAGDVA